jgi:hypothetical protein
MNNNEIENGAKVMLVPVAKLKFKNNNLKIQL